LDILKIKKASRNMGSFQESNDTVTADKIKYIKKKMPPNNANSIPT